MSAWASFWYSGFLPQSKDTQLGLIGDFKLLIGVNECEWFSVSICHAWTGNLSRVNPASHHLSPALLQLLTGIDIGQMDGFVPEHVSFAACLFNIST